MTSRGPMAVLKGLVDACDRAAYVIILATMAAMTVTVALQVFYRYALSSSIDSADELSRLFFIWAMFMAIPPGIKLGVHVGIDIVLRGLSANLQEALFRWTSAASAVLMGLVFYFTIYVTADKWQEMMPTLQFTAAVYYVPILLSAGHAFLRLALLAWGGSKLLQGAPS